MVVDNLAILSLDIPWCYLALQMASELLIVEVVRLARFEEKFKSSYRDNMERVALLKDSNGSEQALTLRLHLLKVCDRFVLSGNVTGFISGFCCLPPWQGQGGQAAAGEGEHRDAVDGQ
jgi:hypothetical protein